MAEELRNYHNLCIGIVGNGKSIIESLLKSRILKNNYRKLHHLPLIRKQSSIYRLHKDWGSKDWV